jgi:hypothetical protein
MNKEQIRAIFLKNGFTVKEGQTDLKDYVYAAADDLLAAGYLEQRKLEATTKECPHDDPQAWRQGLPARTPTQREFEAAYGRDLLNVDQAMLSREHQTGGYTFKETIRAYKEFVAEGKVYWL